MANITKAIVTITPPMPSGGGGSASATALTPSSITSLSLNSGHSPHTTINSPGSLSAATTPMTAVTPTSKHCTFALTPITIPPPPNKVSFLTTAKFHSSSNIAMAAQSTTTTTALVASSASKSSAATTPTERKITPEVYDETPLAGSSCTSPTTSSTIAGHKIHHNHQKLEIRQSVASQITTVEDVDEICKLSLDDDDEDIEDDDDECIGVLIDPHHYSSSHSNSSLSSSAAVRTIRDNITIP